MRPVTKTKPVYLVENELTGAIIKSETLENALIDALGKYCSYCEMPITGYHNEHYRYRASWEPATNIDQWDDLLLICEDCRNQIHLKAINAEQAGAMLWPDLDDTFSLNTDSPFLYELRNVKVLKEDINGHIVDTEERQLVFIVANHNCNDETQLAAQNTINFFALNMPAAFYDAQANELRLPYLYVQQQLDNRMFKRTKAWFEATRAMERLKAMDELGQPKIAATMKNLLIEQIATHIHFSGNWSVWMTVFNNSGMSGASMRKIFTDDKRNFPGTDEAALFSKE